MEFVFIIVVVVVFFLVTKSGESKLDNLDPSALSMEQLKMHQRMCNKKLCAIHQLIANEPIKVSEPNTKYDKLCEKAKKYEAQCKPIEEEIKRRLNDE